MIYFFVLFFALTIVRKYVNYKETIPKLDQYFTLLHYILIPLALTFDLSIGRKSEHLADFNWFVLLSVVMYILYLLRENNIASLLFKAGLPFYIINTLNDLAEYFLPKFQSEYDNIFDLIFLGGLVWMIAYGLSARNQLKNLKKQEEKNKLVTAENEKLDLLVKERTKEILQQKNQLEDTLTELQNTQNQLIQQEKLASLGELTAGIAHEIQNPLNFVNNFSEVSIELIDELKEELEKVTIPEDSVAIIEDLVQNLQKISHHGKRASGIVKSMLEHSRANSGEKQEVDINAMADEYLRLSFHGLRAKDKSFNSDFKLDLAENLPKITATPQDLGRVFLNLCNNAFYAVHKKSTLPDKPADFKPLVTISTSKITEEGEDLLKIVITDNGTGIPDDLKSKIFQPFFTTKPTGQGTGLGLSLSYDIITKGHNGEIEVDSQEGEGTTFIIKLPLNS